MLLSLIASRRQESPQNNTRLRLGNFGALSSATHFFLLIVASGLILQSTDVLGTGGVEEQAARVL